MMTIYYEYGRVKGRGTIRWQGKREGAAAEANKKFNMFDPLVQFINTPHLTS
jgi:hypothetical protein